MEERTMFKSMKQVLLLTVALMVPALLTGCGGSSSAENKKDSAEVKTIKIASPTQDGTASENAMLAQKLGYIDEELEAIGYKAEYVGFAQAGPAINEAFAAGEIDYAFYNEFPAIMAKSNGVDVKIIATVTENNDYAIIAGKDSGVKSARDFAGKKAIATSGTVLYKYFADVCEDNGVDISSVELVNAQADASSVLASGQADLLVTAYSSALQLEAKGVGIVIENTTDNEDERTGITLAATSDTLSSKEDSALALIKALKRAADFAQKNPDEVYGYLTRDGYDKELIKKIYAYDTSFSYFQPGLSDTFRKHVEDQYEFARDNNLLGGEVDLDDLLDDTYLNKVK